MSAVWRKYSEEIMGYLHIDNLYKAQDILLFKECYAMEKIHGTSAHIRYSDKDLKFFSGSEKHERFLGLFDQEHIKTKLDESGIDNIIIYGEAYGGKQQGMSDTYGKELKFIAFDVRIGDHWLSVLKAEQVAKDFNLEFVFYRVILANIEDIEDELALKSEQAKRNGMGDDKIKEGIVLRPLIELTKNNGDRIIAKHKNESFRETKKKRKITDPEKLEILREAEKIAEEWVTPMRLGHILGKIEEPNITMMGDIIKSMVEDIKREGEKEIVWSKSVVTAIGRATALLAKEHFKNSLRKK